MLKVSSLFTDGAVLCRGKEIRIFGEAEDGALIRCELWEGRDRLLCSGAAEAFGGRFTVFLPAQEARGGCRLEVAGAGESFTAEDLCIGEVYLAGGQSNMEMELRNADGGPERIRTHDEPMIRYFNVPRRAYACEEAERAFANARWNAVRPGGAGDVSAVAYEFAVRLHRRLGVPVGIINCCWGGTSVTGWMDREWLCRTAEGRRFLEADEARWAGKTLERYLEEEAAWQKELNAWNERVADYKRDHPRASGAEVNREVGPCPWNPPAGPGSPYRPAALYGTMVSRVAPAALTGVLWYQGENDAGQTDQYDVLLLSMADRWRTAFRDAALPFLLVQLPMWIASDAPGDSFTWPAIRLAQAKVRDTLRCCGMVCLLDQGEWDNLHPSDKRVVGERLYELALRVIYGLEGQVSPTAVGKTAEEGAMTVTFSAPVRVSGGGEPALMELAGADGVFYPARGTAEGAGMRLSAPEVRWPVSARYAWTDYAKVNLFGDNGLPLEPFLL